MFIIYAVKYVLFSLLLYLLLVSERMGNCHPSKKYTSNNQEESYSRNSTHLSKNIDDQVLVPKENPIQEDYVIFNNKKLGSGCNGEVLLCQHRITKKKFALKVILQY